MMAHVVWYLLATVLFIPLSCSHAQAAGDPPNKRTNFSISLGTEFASGDYGTNTTTESVYVPLIVTWFPTERIDIGIEVPYIYQNNSNVTTTIYQGNQTTTVAKVVSKLGGPGGSKANVGTTAVSGSSASAASGLGDIILRLGVIAMFEGKRAPQLRPSVYIKFPTASSSDGLGTGEFDAGGGIEASKWFGDLLLTGEVLYNYLGRVSGFGLKNYFSYTAGFGYQVTHSVRPTFLIKGATAPSDYSGDLLEARIGVLWNITGTTALDLYAARGITDSSPEYGAGVAIIHSF